MASRPAWALRVVRDPLTYANLPAGAHKTEAFGDPFSPQITTADVRRLRATWKGRLVVKGLQRADDAVQAVDLGADAVVLSSHGGRQLDRVPPPLLLVPEVVRRVRGRAEVFVDSGINNGADVVAAVAAGATGCLVGRAYVYGLMAAGEAGVDRVLAMLRRDIQRTMALLGATSLEDLTPDLVTLPVP
jgi:L-lactate dehydrogenase (cytochrome)